MIVQLGVQPEASASAQATALFVCICIWEANIHPMYFNILGCFSAGSTGQAQRTHPFARGYYTRSP